MIFILKTVFVVVLTDLVRHQDWQTAIVFAGLALLGAACWEAKRREQEGSGSLPEIEE
jgi:hypothetical protein